MGTAPLGRRHPRLAQLRRLVRRADERASDGLYVAEGRRLVADLAARGARIRTLVTSPDIELTDTERAQVAEHLVVADGVVDQLADTRSSQGVLAFVERPAAGWPARLGRVLVGDRISDPGNVGALIRTAAALGADGVLFTDGSADPWSPKAVRASAGAIEALPVELVSSAGVVERCAGLALVATSPAAERSALDIDAHAVAWVVGNEAHGVGPELLGAAGAVVSIPQLRSVESLNVAAAAAVVLTLSLVADQRCDPGR